MFINNAISLYLNIYFRGTATKYVFNYVISTKNQYKQLKQKKKKKKVYIYIYKQKLK